MRDNQCGAALHQRFQRGLHMALRFAIQRGGGLVQNQDRCVFKNRARDGDALSLAAGEFHTALADQRTQAFRPFSDEFHRMRGLSGGDDLRFAHVAHLP